METNTGIEDFYRGVDERTYSTAVEIVPDFWVQVFPVKFSHSEGFVNSIDQTVRKVMVLAGGPDGRIDEQRLLNSLGNVIYEVLNNLSGMVELACVAWKGQGPYRSAKCEVFDGHPVLAKLPLDAQGRVVAEWVRLSFLEGKLSPLARLLGDVCEQTIGQRLSVSEIWSRASSPPVIPATKSSNGDEKDGRTGAGPSPSSGFGAGPSEDNVPARSSSRP